MVCLISLCHMFHRAGVNTATLVRNESLPLGCTALVWKYTQRTTWASLPSPLHTDMLLSTHTREHALRNSRACKHSSFTELYLNTSLFSSICTLSPLTSSFFSISLQLCPVDSPCDDKPTSLLIANRHKLNWVMWQLLKVKKSIFLWG